MERSDDPRLLRGLISHRVLVLSNTLALAAARYYPRRFGIRLAEWRVIDALHAGRGITAIEISQWLKTDKAWVGRSVERLVKAGYARRRPDPGHGRRKLLALTPKGERAYREIAAAARQRNESLLAGFTAGEREALERGLAALQTRAYALLARPDLGFGRPATRKK
jgi:DNA-binding MarR family transcriptional regulator